MDGQAQSAVPDSASLNTRTAVVTRDLQREIRIALFRHAARRRSVWLSATIFGLALPATTLAADPDAWLSGATSAIVGFVVAVLYLAWPRGRWLRAVYPRGTLVSTTIASSGLTQVLPAGTSTFAWSDLGLAGTTSAAVVLRTKGSGIYAIPMELVGNVSTLRVLLSSEPPRPETHPAEERAPAADDGFGPTVLSTEPLFSESQVQRLAADFGRFARRRPTAWILPGVSALVAAVSIGRVPVMATVLLACAAVLWTDHPLGAARRARRGLAKATRVDPVIRIEVSETGLRFIKVGARHAIRWSAYRSLWSGTDSVVLRGRNGVLSVVPAVAIPEPHLSMARAEIEASNRHTRKGVLRGRGLGR